MSVTVTKDPNVEGTVSLWTAVGGTKVGVVSDSNDATYVTPPFAGVGADQYYGFEDIPGDSGAPVKEVKLRVRLELTVASGGSVFIAGKLGSFVSKSPVFETEGITDLDYIVPRPGGGAWTVGLVNSAEFGCVSPNWFGGGTAPRALKMQLIVTLDPVPGQTFSIRDLATRKLLSGSKVRAFFDDMVPLYLALTST